MGAANKVTARQADAVALTFDPTEGARGACTVTGNPSRPAIGAAGELPYPSPELIDPLGVLVMGGSQGARSISEQVPAALAALPPALGQRLRVVHQARSEDHDRVTAAYQAAHIEAQVVPFVDVPAALPDTHLVISRSGATTVCDMAVARRPAIYLPLLTHSDLQQVKNASAVVDAGGALLCREDEHDAADLAAMVESLLGDPERLQSMADAARAWSRPDAADAIVALLTHLEETEVTEQLRANESVSKRLKATEQLRANGSGLKETEATEQLRANGSVSKRPKQLSLRCWRVVRLARVA
ncbi:UDP-N-acetylglucosamine--N-acetylmuramyl-(pentapeptide) pyrophosphoryl-undecaprenol N-acetylglucosamine transferase [Nymphon striatum]|nr:UDP-N-acetylglucosamine--N-acetylmuramyl-(pentapeptide) pyrophosphoryl-undecaprenol N-acetylglucosamine transferase [Nymphon striatum]